MLKHGLFVHCKPGVSVLDMRDFMYLNYKRAFIASLKDDRCPLCLVSGKKE